MRLEASKAEEMKKEKATVLKKLTVSGVSHC
jgi:hypothetical protein